MRLDKLTSKFQMALADAQSLAVGQDHQFIEPAHLMVSLLDQQGGSVRALLAKSGVNVNLLRSQLGEAIDRFPHVEGTGGEVHFGSDLTKLFNLTDKLAQQREDQYISSELFALAAIDDKSPLKSTMEQAGAVRGALEKSIDDLRGGQQVNDPNAETFVRKVDFIKRGGLRVYVIQIFNQVLHAAVVFILEQMPVQRSVVAPLLALCDFATHEHQFLARVGIHICVVGPQVRETLPLVTGHAPEQGVFAMHNLIM